MPPSAVVIGATNLMSALADRLSDEGELLTFADTEPIQALQAILEHKPRLIVLERLFAATPRGAALINRIKTDPQLGHAEVRVMSHTGDYTRQVAKGTGEAAVASAPASATLASDGKTLTHSGAAQVVTQDPPRSLASSMAIPQPSWTSRRVERRSSRRRSCARTRKCA